MSKGRRAFAWLVSLLGGVAISYLLALLRMPDAPHGLIWAIGLVMGIAIAVVMELLGRDQRNAFDAVYQWDHHRARELIASRTSRRYQELDPYGMAAMEILLGNVQGGLARLAAEPVKVGPAARLKRCVEAQAELMTGTRVGLDDLVDRLATEKPLSMTEAERYRVALLARAALGATPTRRDRVAELLMTHRDDEARAFGQWLRAAAARPFDARDREKDAQRGAELASQHGLEALAHQLEDRAAAIARWDRRGPYRG